ncbi:MAG: chitobiase/beta-hexosaminidase C-terminal domain-containing protein [Akkermansiaceae bacterium]|nr:chitobiase/beta-hexosaminidase C-terminal domain-containing protein [Akkermansiaceae bacterium]
MRRPHYLLLVVPVLMTAIPARAMEFNIPNPSLAPAKKVLASEPGLPSKWKLTGGKADDCRKWVGKNRQGEEMAHVALSRGVTLTTRFAIPPLTDKEKKAKGEWSGLLSLDHLGVGGTGASNTSGIRGIGTFKLTLHTVEDGRMKASLTGRARYATDTDALKVTRVWCEVPVQTMSELEGKQVELRLTAAGSAPVVISAVSLCRLHSAPSGKLFGRSNGGSGPDLLGAGSLGFNGMTEHRQNVLTVISVTKGGPAERAGLKEGDRIIGVNKTPLPVNDLNPGWAWFYHSHEAVLGRAVTAAWSANPPLGKGMVELVILRKGKPFPISCELTQSMPFDTLIAGKDKEALHAQMIGFLEKSQRPDGSWGCPIRTTFSALALLATQDPRHAPRIKKAVDGMLNKYPEPENFGNLGFWHSSYAGILYCEYYLATGDKRVLPRIASILDWIHSGTHTSKWGMACLGHGVGGLPYGQKALVAPACHALVLDALAEKCGVSSGLWKTLLPYMEYSWSDPAKGGHGSLGYNASFKDKGQFWSRSGLFAMAAHLRGERTDMETAMIGFMRGHHPWIRNSHAYGEPGGSIGLLALNLCNPDAFHEVFNAYGWWFALAWEPGYGLRFTTPHMGAPYMGTDDLINATYALVFAAPQKSLCITGGEKRSWLDVSQLETEPNPVLIRRNKDGKVRLACRIPGPEIRYTVDGTEPGKDAPIYTGDFDFANGGTIKARASGSSGRLGEVTTQSYGPAKSGWRILAATGHKDPAEAIRRASYAIDHSPTHSWLTDVGQDAKGYPHFIVIDLGQETEFRSVRLGFFNDRTAAKQCTVKASNTLDQTPRTVAQTAWEAFQATRTIVLPEPVKMRYLRLEFAQPLHETATALILREVDVE